IHLSVNGQPPKNLPESATLTASGPNVPPGTMIPILAEGPGTIRGALTFNESGKFELTFSGKVDGAQVTVTRVVNVPPPAGGGDVPFVQVGNGDATIQLGVHIFYRPFRDWAFGANFLFDPKPTASTCDTQSGLARTCSRAYFFIGGEARYIPLHWRSIEGFV